MSDALPHPENDLPEALEALPSEERAALGALWHLLDEAEAEPAPDVEQAWAGLRARLDAAPAPPNVRARPSRRAHPSREAARPARRRLWAPATAALLVLLGLALAWSRPVELAVAPGARLRAALPDGSHVTLGGGSVLRYRRGFAALPGVPGRERLVALRGEAFFEVAKGRRPFVVETFDARVEVLGTRFEVQAWEAPSLRETRVVLASGSVRLTARGEAAPPVVLSEAGRRARTVGGRPEAEPGTAPLGVGRAWRGAGFHAEHQPLAAILARLEQRYGRRLILGEGVAAEAPLTLLYPEAVALEAILEDIGAARGLAYRPVQGGYEIVKRQGAP